MDVADALEVFLGEGFKICFSQFSLEDEDDSAGNAVLRTGTNVDVGNQ